MSHEQQDNHKLWPPAQYHEQISILKQHLNTPLFIVPLNQSKLSLSFSFSNNPLEIVAIVDYPCPDPENHLYPHLLIFNDGSGLNLGRVLRISLNTPFSPKDEDILYRDKPLQQSLMLAPRRLSKESIAMTSKLALAHLLNTPESEKIIHQMLCAPEQKAALDKD